MGLSQPVMIRTEYVKCQDEVLWVYVCSIVNQLSVHYMYCVSLLGVLIRVILLLGLLLLLSCNWIVLSLRSNNRRSLCMK